MALNQSPATSKYMNKRWKTKENKLLLCAAKQLQGCSAELSRPVALMGPESSLPHIDDEKISALPIRLLLKFSFIPCT